MGFFEALDRPFDPVADGTYAAASDAPPLDAAPRTPNLLLHFSCCSAWACSSSRPSALLQYSESLPAPGAGRCRPSRRWAPLLGCSAGRSAPSSAPALPSPPPAQAVSCSTRSTRVQHKPRIISGPSRMRSPTTASAGTAGDELLTGCAAAVIGFVELRRVAVDNSRSPGLDARSPRRAATGRRFRGPDPLPHLVDVRRSPLARALDACSPGSGSTTGRDTTSSRPRPADAPRPAFLRGRVADHVGDFDDRPWPEGSSFYHFDNSTTGATWGITARVLRRTEAPGTSSAATPRAREAAHVGTSSRSATWCRATRRGHASPADGGHAVGDDSSSRAWRRTLEKDITIRRPPGCGRGTVAPIQINMHALTSFVQRYGDDDHPRSLSTKHHQPAKVSWGKIFSRGAESR